MSGKRHKKELWLDPRAKLFLMCALQRTFLTGESPQSALVVGRIQPRPRMSIARWNLKEGGGKSLV